MTTELLRLAELCEQASDEEAAVIEWMADDTIYPFVSLAGWSGLSERRVAEIVRGFAQRGLAKIGSGYDEETGRVHGRGYFLTVEGAKVQASLRARSQESNHG